MQNYGSDTLTSVNVNWSINATNQTPFAWTGTVAPYADTLLTIGTYSFSDGDTLSIWTSMPNGMAEAAGGSVNDSASITIQSGLAGTYTIGATGDYATFTDAANDLETYGVCSAVIFNVQDGTYNEQISIEEIPGASAVNTITFQSENADPALVDLTFAATSTAIIPFV